MGPGSIAASVRSMRTVFSGAGSDHISKQSSKAEEKDDSDSVASEDSDIESVFAYTRVAQLPPTFFRKHLVSCCLIDDTVHAYATHSGIVHLSKPDGTPIRTVRVHRSSVLDIASHKSGVVATASIDGTVVIASIEDAGDTVQASFRRPVHSIALHPDYANLRSYISGGTAGQVVLSERSWLKSRTDTVLAQTKSTILALSWPESARLVWCNEDGITLYNPVSRAVLGNIARPPHAPRADLYRPRICVSEGHAIVAWHRSIYLVSLESAELVHRVDVPYTVAGAVPFHGLRQFAVLAVDTDTTELKLVDARTGDSSYEDEIALQDAEAGSPKLGPNDYYLQGRGSKLWIVSASDAVVARERTARDHVDWLAEHGRFIEAYAAAKHPSVDIDDKARQELGRSAANEAADAGDWVTAANLLRELDEHTVSRDEWLAWSARFIGAQKPLLLGNILPALELNDVHDSVLDAAVAERDADRLGTWIDTWPLTVYNGPRLATKLEAETSDADSRTPALLQVLARLWLKLGEYVKAVQALVAADSPRAFQVAGHYHLWTEPEVLGMLGAVVSAGDGDGGDGGYVSRLRELIAQRAEIPPTKVVAQLARNIDNPPTTGQAETRDTTGELLLFGYLTELGQVDEPALGQFADLVVRLYAKYDPHKLLRFFERFDTYDLDASIALCRKQNLDRELVYLLGRVGRSSESLEIIVTKLQDYAAAVQFARTHETSTWDELVEYCSAHPKLVLEMLKCVEVSPARVLASIPEDMRIPGLKDALCKVLNNQETSLELSTGALSIIRAESQRWTQELRASRARGTEGDSDGAIDWRVAQLLTEHACVPAPWDPPVATFSNKIAHLRRVVKS